MCDGSQRPYKIVAFVFTMLDTISSREVNIVSSANSVDLTSR
jgi:hypothetical protein